MLFRTLSHTLFWAIYKPDEQAHVQPQQQPTACLSLMTYACHTTGKSIDKWSNPSSPWLRQQSPEWQWDLLFQKWIQDIMYVITIFLECWTASLLCTSFLQLIYVIIIHSKYFAVLSGSNLPAHSSWPTGAYIIIWKMWATYHGFNGIN